MGNYADALTAQVYREQWANYLARFAPLEEELITSYQSPEIRNRMLSDAATRTGQAFDTAQGIYGRTLSRITPSQDATERAETSRLFGMNRTLAQVDARNRTRQGLAELDQAILGGGLTAGAMKQEGT